MEESKAAACQLPKMISTNLLLFLSRVFSLLFILLYSQVSILKLEQLNWITRKSNCKYGKLSIKKLCFIINALIVNNLRDTAGQERFRTITTAYYRGAMGIMLVYDITQEKSFENIKNWIRNIEENAAADVEKMLLGNKCELNDKRQVIINQEQFNLTF